ncbi:hypothetical protein B0H12DRAFT_1145880 [Mycena haematopus]|nr:hypothetical protein B0H12DRAFT_1145880 [Mycena haematopus]
MSGASVHKLHTREFSVTNSLSKVTTRKPAELKINPILVLTVNTFGTTETTAISFGFWLNQNII